MTLLVEKGTFVKRSGTGSQTVTLADSSLTPKVVWLWTTGQTSNAAYDSHFLWSYGYSDGTTDACISNISQDAAGSLAVTSAHYRQDAIMVIPLTTTPATVACLADLTSLNAGNFILNWSTNDTSAAIIHYMVMGGTDITGVKVLNTTIGSTTTGAKAYTGAGFQPDFVNFLSPGLDVLNTSIATSSPVIGVATSSTSEWFLGTSCQNGQVTMNTFNYKESSTACIAGFTVTNGARNFIADFTTFGVDGFTFNVTDGAVSTTQRFSALCIKGGLWNVGTGTAPASTGSQTVTTTSGRDASGVMLFSWGNTTNTTGTTGQAHARISIGGCDNSLNEGCISVMDTDAVTVNAVTSRMSLVTKSLQVHTSNATATSSTLVAEADITNMSNDGNFVLDWTTTLSGMGYVWFTVSEVFAAAQQFDRTASDTITISEPSLTTQETYARAPSLDSTTVTAGTATRLLSATRTPTTETITIAESSLIKSRTDVNTVSDSTTVTAGTITRLLSAIRAASDTTTVTAGTATRMLSATRTPSETITLSESITPLKTTGVTALTRQVSDRVTVGEGAYSLYVHIPLYIYPFHWIAGSEWYQIRDLITASPDVIFFCKINVNSGPDTALNTDYTTGIGILKSQGNDKHIKILGYVFTSYAARDIADVKTDIDRWVSFYGSDINGIFLDEMQPLTGSEAYYQEITNYIHKDKGLEISWGNPGNAIAESYVKANAVDVFQIAESTDYPSSATITASTFSGTYSPSKFALGIHSVTTYDSTAIADLYTKASYIFVTGDVMPTPYDTVSAYIDDLAAQSAAIPKATRSVSRIRSLSDTTTITGETLTRLLSALRNPSADTVTSAENLVGAKSYPRFPGTDSITVADFSLTRLLSARRTPSENVSLTESILRSRSRTVGPSTDSVIIADFSLIRVYSALRVASDSTTIGETRVRLLSAARTGSDSVTIVDFSLNRLLSATRIPSQDTIALSESLIGQKIVGAQQYNRIASDTTTIGEILARIYSALRTASDTTIVTDNRARLYSAVRIPGLETVTIGDNLATAVSGRISRTASDTVIITEQLARLLSLRRSQSDVINLNEQVQRIKTLPRAPLTDAVIISDASLIRALSLTRTPASDSRLVLEAALTRILSAFRSPSIDIVPVSELTAEIEFSRSILETISITEPTLQRILTAYRTLSDSTPISEVVFYETLHRFVFDFVPVQESLFYKRQQLSGPVTYATVDEVRPLLGNLGDQRTDPQIELAVAAAYDEINRRTNRIPPNDWKDTDIDFDIIKKIARYTAVEELAIGIKDFDTKQIHEEIEYLYGTIEQHGGAESTSDLVVSSSSQTYASSAAGIIWSTRYPLLRKKGGTGSGGLENSYIIPQD